jgi:electron transport complex protein RnfG
MFFSLFLICVASAAIVTGANLYTAQPIQLSQAKALKDAIAKVTPAYDNDPVKESYMAPIPGTKDSLRIYPAKKGGKMVGVAVDSYTMKGFKGLIKVIVGFDMQGKLINYSVLQHSETPGLGSRMDSWFRTKKNHQSVIGLTVPEGGLKVTKDGGTVDAITASTITSRAFLDAINRAAAAFKGTQVDAASGATAQKKGVTSK